METIEAFEAKIEPGMNKEDAIISFMNLGFEKLIDFILIDNVYKKIYETHLNMNLIQKQLEIRKLESENFLEEKLLPVYASFDNDRDYETTYKIVFPQFENWIRHNNYNFFDKNYIRTDTMFEMFEIEIESKFLGTEIIPDSLIERKLFLIDKNHYIQREYIEVFEMFVKLLKYDLHNLIDTYQSRDELKISAKFYNPKLVYKPNYSNSSRGIRGLKYKV